MKHILMSTGWTYSNEPFPAYRSELVFGRNKRDREFLAIKNIAPEVIYTVTADYGKTELYKGSDKAAAEAAKATYDEQNKGTWKSANFQATQPTLPEGKFKVIKTKEKGTILVVAGEDKSNRCLLFVGCAGGFRGGESVLQDGTTATILKTCSAGNACESRTEVIVLMEVGQTVAFYSYGRRTNEVYLYTWDGTEVVQTHYSKSEWDERNTASQIPADAEEM